MLHVFYVVLAVLPMFYVILAMLHMPNVVVDVLHVFYIVLAMLHVFYVVLAMLPVPNVVLDMLPVPNVVVDVLHVFYIVLAMLNVFYIILAMLPVPNVVLDVLHVFYIVLAMLPVFYDILDVLHVFYVVLAVLPMFYVILAMPHMPNVVVTCCTLAYKEFVFFQASGGELWLWDGFYPQQRTLQSSFNPLKQEELDCMIVELVAAGNLSFSFVELPEFQCLIDYLSRKELTSMATETFKKKLRIMWNERADKWAAFEKAHRQYLAKKRGRSHFDVGDYVLFDKDRDHKLHINVRGLFQVIEKLDHHCYTIKNLLWDFRDNDPRSWISYDNNKNVDQIVAYMQAHSHLRT
eukprot:m51a1_g12445 hypothetical protein (349) ;mRNA; r:861862-865942